MKNLRKTLYPFAMAYKGVTALRNAAYDYNWLKKSVFDLSLIGVGNLSTGGTGKSPMTEYLIQLLRPTYNVATISRGYGRKTSGFREVNSSDRPDEVGDEPLQFKTKFPDVTVVVDEKRVHAVSHLLQQSIIPEVIILDDVYQHRSIQPGFLILLSSYDALFYKDYVLPAGNLRESRSGASRAHAIVITKCPPDLSQSAQETVKNRIRRYSKAPVFFSTIAYGLPLKGDGKKLLDELKKQQFTVVTGIAKPTPFIDYLRDKGLTFEHKKFPDHHAFTQKEIDELDACGQILTTEKDYMRLKDRIKSASLYYLPITTHFLNGETRFNTLIEYYCSGNKS